MIIKIVKITIMMILLELVMMMTKITMMMVQMMLVLMIKSFNFYF